MNEQKKYYGKDIIAKKGSLKQECRVKLYDFKRPDKFSKDQIRTLAMLHETFARLMTFKLSAMLRTDIHLHVKRVDQITYEEFIRPLPKQNVLAVIKPDPLKFHMLYQLDPQLFYAIIDRIYGGNGSDYPINRNLTDIEQVIFQGMIIRTFKCLQDAWSNVAEITPKLMAIEAHPDFVQIVPPSDMVVLVEFEMKINKIKGLFNIVLPYITIEPLIPKLSAKYWYSAVKRKEKSRQTNIALGNINIDSKIYQLGEKISLKDINQLKKNNLIPLANGDSNYYLNTGGTQLFRLKKLKDNRNKTINFSILPEQNENKLKEEFIFFAKYLNAKTKTSENNEQEKFSQIIEDFSQKMQNQFAQVHSNMKNISLKQEDLQNQLFFRQNGENPEANWQQITGTKQPFDFMARLDTDLIVNVIKTEHPQTIAAIISYLSPVKASQILCSLDPEIQPEIARRIMKLERTAPQVISGTEECLQRIFKIQTDVTFVKTGGIRSIVEILNLTPRHVEKNVVETLEKQDPETAENIKKNMFVFEDMILIDNRAIKKLLANIDINDLSLALKNIEDTIKQHFLSNMDKKTQEELTQKIESLGRIKIKDIDKARQTIISTLRKLEKNGEVIVARPEETIE